MPFQRTHDVHAPLLLFNIFGLYGVSAAARVGHVGVNSRAAVPVRPCARPAGNGLVVAHVLVPEGQVVHAPLRGRRTPNSGNVGSRNESLRTLDRVIMFKNLRRFLQKSISVNDVSLLFDAL